MQDQLILDEIYVYPVKSLAGFKVKAWPVDKKGLKFDRKWMLIDKDNHFLSQRKIPAMGQISTEIIQNKLILNHPNQESIDIPLNPVQGEEQITTLWGKTYPAQSISNKIDEWLSHCLNLKCRLVFQPDSTIRQVDQRYAQKQDQTTFSDGFPFLIVSQASLLSLSQSVGKQLDVVRFRPNLVVSNSAAYAEDEWREIRINQIQFRLPKPCSRCAIPTIDPKTAKTGKEPLKTLNKTRKWNKQVYFGQNALHDATGELIVGSSIEILKTGPAQPPL